METFWIIACKRQLIDCIRYQPIKLFTSYKMARTFFDENNGEMFDCPLIMKEIYEVVSYD